VIEDHNRQENRTRQYMLKRRWSQGEIKS